VGVAAAYFEWALASLLNVDRNEEEIQRMKASAFVRISCRSRAEAKELALRLEAHGYAAVVRRWKTVIASTEPVDEGRRTAPSTALLWAWGPRNPLATLARRGASITPSATSSLWPWV